MSANPFRAKTTELAKTKLTDTTAVVSWGTQKLSVKQVILTQDQVIRLQFSSTIICQRLYQFFLLKISEINECLSSPCNNSAACSDGLNGYTCSCLAGFTGDHCQTGEIECCFTCGIALPAASWLMFFYSLYRY